MLSPLRFRVSVRLYTSAKYFSVSYSLVDIFPPHDIAFNNFPRFIINVVSFDLFLEISSDKKWGFSIYSKRPLYIADE